MSDSIARTIRSFCIGLAGAAISYFSVWVSGHDFGSATVWIVPLAGMLVDLLRRQIPVSAINPPK